MGEIIPAEDVPPGVVAEVGAAFTVTQPDVKVGQLGWYRAVSGPAQQQEKTIRLWSGAGAALASCTTSGNGDTAGWRFCPITATTLTAGSEYVVSVSYRGDSGESKRTAGPSFPEPQSPLAWAASPSRFGNTAGSFPSSVGTKNYGVDVIAQTGTTPPPPTPTPTPAPPPPTPTPTPAPVEPTPTPTLAPSEPAPTPTPTLAPAEPTPTPAPATATPTPTPAPNTTPQTPPNALAPVECAYPGGSYLEGNGTVYQWNAAYSAYETCRVVGALAPEAIRGVGLVGLMLVAGFVLNVGRGVSKR